MGGLTVRNFPLARSVHRNRGETSGFGREQSKFSLLNWVESVIIRATARYIQDNNFYGIFET